MVVNLLDLLNFINLEAPDLWLVWLQRNSCTSFVLESFDETWGCDSVKKWYCIMSKIIRPSQTVDWTCRVMAWFLIEWLSNFKIDCGYLTEAREFINGRLFFFFIFLLLSLVYFKLILAISNFIHKKMLWRKVLKLMWN